MNWNDLYKKMQEINAKINESCDLNYLEENMKYVFEAGKFYNENCGSLSIELADQIRQSYQFFSRYLIVYMAKKYNKHLGYQLEADTPVSHFFKNTIYLSKNMIGKSDFEHIMFTIFHEFRHKMQYDDFNNIFNDINSILSIDPVAIIFFKEKVTHADTQLYNANHNCFICEHDANLFALSECGLLIDKKKLEQDYSKINETTNYIDAMITGIDLTGEEFNDRQQLPIIYEHDYRFKKIIAGKKVINNSMLSLIYNSNGTPKTYQELLEEKKKLFEKYKGQTVDRKTSTTNYEKWSNSKRAEDHIEEIFRLIIASDPILTIQEYLYKWNSIEDKRYAKQYMDKIIRLLDECPQLSTIYFEEIKTLLVAELRKGNVEMVQNIVSQNGIFQSTINFYTQFQTKKSSSFTDEYDIEKEKVPFSSKPKASSHRPKISESVKKVVISHDQKQKLHEMKQQLLEQERQRKEHEAMNQEALNDEETHGMSM